MGTRVEFAILGPLEVRLDGAPAQIGGPKQRALLAMLLCNANRVVSRSADQEAQRTRAGNRRPRTGGRE